MPKRTMLCTDWKRSSRGGVGNENALLLAEDVVHDGAADGDLLLRLTPSRQRTAFGSSSACRAWRGISRPAAAPSGRGGAQHDAAAIGFDRPEHQLQDAVEQLLEVENVADGLVASYMTPRLARAVLSHVPSTFSGWARMRLPSASPMVLTMADGQLQVLPGDQADLVGEVAAGRRLALRPAPKTRMVWPMRT